MRLPSSGMAIDLRRLTASIAAPKMPVLYTAVSIVYDATESPPSLRLADLDLRTQRSTIPITGDARLGRMPSVNLK
jgi:hypothetical protein